MENSIVVFYYRILVEDGGSYLIDIGSVGVTDVGTNDAISFSFLNSKLLTVVIFY